VANQFRDGADGCEHPAADRDQRCGRAVCHAHRRDEHEFDIDRKRQLDGHWCARKLVRAKVVSITWVGCDGGNPGLKADVRLRNSMILPFSACAMVRFHVWAADLDSRKPGSVGKGSPHASRWIAW
jgi:hypothetical protein